MTTQQPMQRQLQQLQELENVFMEDNRPGPAAAARMVSKLRNADPDIRYMTLADLRSTLMNNPDSLYLREDVTCAKILQGLLEALIDKNGDVQNEALAALGAFVRNVTPNMYCPIIDKVSFIAMKDAASDNSVAALGLRTIVANLERPGVTGRRGQRELDSYNAVSKALVPRLIGHHVLPKMKGTPLPSPKGMLKDNVKLGTDSNSLDLLIDVTCGFGAMLQADEVQALQEAAMGMLENVKSSPAVKKKALAALSALAPYFHDQLLANVVSYTIEKLQNPQVSNQDEKNYLHLYGILARSSSQKFGSYLQKLTPLMLAPLSQQKLDEQLEEENEGEEEEPEKNKAMEEVREAALTAIENCLKYCPAEMRADQDKVIQATMRFLKYEQNSMDNDEDMEDEPSDPDMDEDFEEETGFEEEEDVRWKVRRCTAKATRALVDSMEPNEEALYSIIAPALVSRFKEGEEAVRLEVLEALSAVVSKSVGSMTAPVQPLAQPSRKRRRVNDCNAALGGSASTLSENGPKGLVMVFPDIVKGATRLLKTSTDQTKTKSAFLLRDAVMAHGGGLADLMDQVIDAAVGAMVSGPTPTVQEKALRVSVMQLLKAIADTHSFDVLQPQLAKILPDLSQVVKGRNSSVSLATLETIEALAKALTPPRCTNSSSAQSLRELFKIVTEPVSANDVITDVRRKAVSVLGVFIGRTSGQSVNLLGQNERFSGQQMIADRLKKEVTRLAAVHAVDTIALLAQSKKDFKPGYMSDVALELGKHLSMASRALRGASLGALRTICLNQACCECLDDKTVSQLIKMLVPLLKSDDLHMVVPTLIILAALVHENADLVVTPTIIEGICHVVTLSNANAAADALIPCVEAIGRSGQDKELMTALLETGIKGDIDVTGQVIGTLLVTGGPKTGVVLDDFTKELQRKESPEKTCLALAVLGEAGLRMGVKSPLRPETFESSFADEQDKVKLAAAIALGRAGAGNVKEYLPKIMDALGRGSQYLLLHSVKELLLHSTVEEYIKPYAQQLWQNVISSGQADNDKVVGAECIGRLAVIEPAVYLPQMQSLLQNSQPAIRGMAISAMRYVFSDAEVSIDAHMKGAIGPMLTTMLADSDVDNQRLALTTFKSALQNKSNLVIPRLSRLLPLIMQATAIRSELVHEVMMGPFKHKIDDGLEMRTTAYETLFALIGTPVAQTKMDTSAIFHRVTDGLRDEHEIKLLSCLIINKLIDLAPDETSRQLDNFAPVFKAILSVRPKETSVKQELEKMAEQNRSVAKTSVVLQRKANSSDCPVWREYFAALRKDYPTLYKYAEHEVYEDTTV
ncbi:TIP120-domain-containing protein [Piedraia hortae CBS 480.64]|uniref:TIP120-domain-containing protein n=1 Tax=Piedraia hortae CBS 480.64 TaxID=1314780 RepID=A0A6A7C6M9_9PEZI|nr:TIP120-domain-containing protein [Piedraia hortae CBS 480.64]